MYETLEFCVTFSYYLAGLVAPYIFIFVMQNPELVDPAALPETPASARESMRECLRTLKRQNKVANLNPPFNVRILLVH